MQLQQNLFSIYRLLLRLPHYLLLLLCAGLLVLAVSQIASIIAAPSPLKLQSCLSSYFTAKNPPYTHNETVANGSEAGNSSKTVRHESTLQPRPFLDEGTVLHIRMTDTPNCTHEMNYNYEYGNTSLPLVALLSNDQLGHLEHKSRDYLERHNISYDLINIPTTTLSAPLYTFLPPERHQSNQFVIESLIRSLPSVNNDILLPVFEQLIHPSGNLTANTTEYNKSTPGRIVPTAQINELFLLYFYAVGEASYQHKINMMSEITLAALPKLILKIFYCIALFIGLYIGSMFVGLFIRYLLISTLTLFLIVFDRCLGESWGWIHQHLRLLVSRYPQQPLSTLKMGLLYCFSTFGTYCLITFGLYCVITRIVAPLLILEPTLFTQFMFKTLFLIQTFHYLCCRSRTSLRFFPILSFLVSYFTLVLGVTYRYYWGVQMLNLNLSLQLILFVVFLIIQKYVFENHQKGLISSYCPSLNKPRMLFYAGYDISWEKSLPPIWTYFTQWFDYSFFSDNEKSLLEKDYQMLYGLMLGLSQRQQIPQEEDEGEQRRLREQPSNEMNLIQE